MISGIDHRELIAELAQSEAGVTVTCASPSMEPTIRVGDTVTVRRVDTVKAGDVVVFQTADGSALMLHRVVVAIAGIPWIGHVGDASSPWATGLFHRERLVGVADVTRRAPRSAAVAVALARIARRAAREAAHRVLGRKA